VFNRLQLTHWQANKSSATSTKRIAAALTRIHTTTSYCNSHDTQMAINSIHKMQLLKQLHTRRLRNLWCLFHPHPLL